MPDYKKLDEIDVLISNDITPEESKRISKYLQAYKAKQARPAKARSLPSARMKEKAKAKR